MFLACVSVGRTSTIAVMDPPSVFPPQVEQNYQAFKAKRLKPPIDDWLRRMKPKNKFKLSTYFPTLEKMFDRGETAYNNEDWRRAYQDSMKVATFILECKKIHNGWRLKVNQKETYRMIRVVLPKCISYAEQCQVEMKKEMAMEMEAKSIRELYQQQLEQERIHRATEAAERKVKLLEAEAQWAQDQELAAAAAAAAAATAQAAAAAAAQAAAVAHHTDATHNSLVIASVVDDADASSSAHVVLADVVDDGSVPFAPLPDFATQPLSPPFFEGQEVTYQKNTVSLPARIVKVHTEDPEAEYYTINIPGIGEKQTTRQYLNSTVVVSSSSLPPPPLPPPKMTPPPTVAFTQPIVNLNPGIDFSELGAAATSTVPGSNRRHHTPSLPPTAPTAPPTYQPRTSLPPAAPATGPLYGQVNIPSSSTSKRHLPTPPPPPPRQHQSIGPWKVNSKCDIKDYFTSKYTKREVTQWRRGQVLAINGSKVLVTFEGWSGENDCWINYAREPQRLAAYGSKTAAEEQQWQNRTLSFKDQMTKKGFQIVTMRGDGNCLFRAVAHQIWGDPELHAMVRTMVCDFMLANGGEFAEVLGALVPGPNGFARYVAQMRRPCYQGNGEWGGDPEIRVMEEIFDRPFELWDVERGSGKGPANIHLEGSLPEDHRVDPIRVSYHGKNHYNSVQNTDVTRRFPLGELNTSAIRRFRKRGSQQRTFDTGYK